MKTGLIIALGAIAVFLLVAIVWRLFSQRQSLPCPVWLGWMVEMDNPFTKTNRAVTIISNLNLEPGMQVVDVGCGPGRLAIPVAKAIGNEGKLVAMDIQHGMLERVQEKAQAESLKNIEYIHSGVGQGNLTEGRFDRALLVTVLGEIPDQKTALREVFDALKPGGVLSVTEVIFDPHFQRYGVVKKLAEEVGFRELAFFGNKIAYTLSLEKQ